MKRQQARSACPLGLLVVNAAIGSQHQVKPGSLGDSQKLAIRQFGPAYVVSGPEGVFCQRARNPFWEVLVKDEEQENPCPGAKFSTS